MEKKFNEEAYRNGSEVVCDVCGSVIQHINVKTRIIASKGNLRCADRRTSSGRRLCWLDDGEF